MTEQPHEDGKQPHERNTARIARVLGLILCLVAVTAGVGTYLALVRTQGALRESRAANRDAHEALRRARVARSAVEIRLCEDLKQVVAINNRDRGTLLRSQRNNARTQASLRRQIESLHEPDARKLGELLLALVRGSAASSAHEVKIRPHISSVGDCRKFVHRKVLPLPSP